MTSRSFAICLRVVFVTLLASWLAGCALPPALTILTTAADGVSFIATGKSFPDIALSAMTDKDCAVYRVVTDRAICRGTFGDGRPANIIISSDVVAQFDAVDESSESFYMVRHGDEVLTATVAGLTTKRALLKGFPEGTELFALVHDDGTLEVFAHNAARARDRSNMRLIARISGYAAVPESFTELRLNGANYAVRDIIV